MRGIVLVQGLIEVLGVSIFLVGFFGEVVALSILGGLIMLGDDVVSIWIAALNPLVPILAAVVLGAIWDPWYLGVFWSMAIFHIWAIPTALRKVFAPATVVAAVTTDELEIVRKAEAIAFSELKGFDRTNDADSSDYEDDLIEGDLDDDDGDDDDDDDDENWDDDEDWEEEDDEADNRDS